MSDRGTPRTDALVYSDNNCVEGWHLFRDLCRTLERELSACQKECEEQARLNGAGSSREVALLARLGVAQKKLGILGPCEHIDHEDYCQSHFVERDCTAKAMRDAIAALNGEAK